MAKKTYLHRGLITKLDEKFAKIAGLFDLERFVRDTLYKFGVQYTDVCCEESYLQKLTGAGAVFPTTPYTQLITTGANALTLADGKEGQRKTVVMITDGGDGTLTPANPLGFSSIVFNSVGDSVDLLFINSKWVVTGSYGVVIS